MARRAVHFLGWDGAPIPRVVDWLRENLGAELHEWTIALPGGRAVRTLRRGLAAAPQGSGAPEVLTGGALTDRLLDLPGEAATRLARTLCWEQVLRGARPADLRLLAGMAVEGGDDGRLRGLAGQLRQAHADLVGAGLGVEQVLACDVLAARPRERDRWQLFGRLQGDYRGLLAEAGLEDPHDRRRKALDEGRLRTGAQVVLVDLAEPQPLRDAVLEKLDGTVHHLVLAPEDEAHLFDGDGCLVRDAWLERPLQIALDDWRVVADPAAQCEAVLAGLAEASLDGETAVGLADPRVLPELTEAFARQGVTLRDGSGAPLLKTPELRLLRLVANALREPTPRSFADLWRHPWFEAALARAMGGEPAPIGDLDAYVTAHLVDDLREELLGTRRRETERNTRIQRALEQTEALLAPLLGAKGRTDTLEALRALLAEVAPVAELDSDDPGQQPRIEALRQLARILDELAAVPQLIASGRQPADHLERVLQVAEDARVPPPPPQPNAPTVEALGWLELAMDPAPRLVVTSVLEGLVPAAAGLDSLLPAALRRDLGLPSEEDRLARDLHLAQVLCASRRTTWVTPRLGPGGDPALPSRLLLRASAAETAARVRHWTDGGRRIPVASPPRPPLEPPARLRAVEPLQSLPVTAFRRWLQAPFLFHTAIELDLRACTDAAREIDAAGFGTLLHGALEVLGEKDLCACADPEVLRQALADALSDRARKTYGSSPRPAVALQIEQAHRRLELFVPVQVQRVQAGWRVREVEWRAPEPVQLPCGTLAIRGSIDRIDEHEDGRLCLLDYKSSSKRKKPERAHRTKEGTWMDLQLPLYVHLAGQLTGDAPVHGGYVALGPDDSNTGFEDWFDMRDHVQDALDEASRIAEQIRAGALPPTEARYRPFDPFEGYLVGHGLDLAESEEGDE